MYSGLTPGQIKGFSGGRREEPLTPIFPSVFLFFLLLCHAPRLQWLESLFELKPAVRVEFHYR